VESELIYINTYLLYSNLIATKFLFLLVDFTFFVDKVFESDVRKKFCAKHYLNYFLSPLCSQLLVF
jgi:hypothetical protein